MRAKIDCEGKMRANEGALINEGKVASLSHFPAIIYFWRDILSIICNTLFAILKYMFSNSCCVILGCTTEIEVFGEQIGRVPRLRGGTRNFQD